MIWRYNRHYTDKTLKCTKYLNMRASEASLKFSHFHILKQYPSIFCGYFRYFVSETYYFHVSNNICIYYTINAVSFYYLRYGAIIINISDSIPTNTNIKEMNV